MTPKPILPHITPKIKAALFARVDRSEIFGCWPWTGYRSRKGYGALQIGGYWLVHRLVFVLSRGREIEPGKVIAHNCHNRACCNPRHLREATIEENNADRLADGTLLRGEKSPFATLTGEQVRAIVQQHRNGVSIGAIARMYGAKHKTIADIVHGRTWQYVTGLPTKLRPTSKPITRGLALEIVNARNGGTSRAQVARDHGMCPQVIRDIERGNVIVVDEEHSR